LNICNIFYFSYNTVTFQYIPPTNPTATSVTSSSIFGNILTFGTAQTLEEGAFYMLSGSNVVPNSYIIGTGSSTATYYIMSIILKQ
jgi:hypothetical protein